jgi:hypothetical protein
MVQQGNHLIEQRREPLLIGASRMCGSGDSTIKSRLASAADNKSGIRLDQDHGLAGHHPGGGLSTRLKPRAQGLDRVSAWARVKRACQQIHSATAYPAGSTRCCPDRSSAEY